MQTEVCIIISLVTVFVCKRVCVCVCVLSIAL